VAAASASAAASAVAAASKPPFYATRTLDHCFLRGSAAMPPIYAPLALSEGDDDSEPVLDEDSAGDDERVCELVGSELVEVAPVAVAETEAEREANGV
jgi:hypothetical protein